MDLQQPFSDPKSVARYAEGPPRLVPGFAGLLRMSELLLSERAPSSAEILVLGAGGGLELKAFSEARPQWRFVGVDPSAAMLELARETLGPLVSRVRLQQGYIEDTPPGLFDGGACLLTLHFLEQQERLRTLQELRARLKPGAPLVVAHHSIPAGGDKIRWLSLSAKFAAGRRADEPTAIASATIMAERLPVLHSNQDEALLAQAGFTNVDLFYAGLTFHGWVATA